MVWNHQRRDKGTSLKSINKQKSEIGASKKPSSALSREFLMLMADKAMFKDESV